MYLSFKAVKTYENGTTYAVLGHGDRIDGYVAEVDAEDREAGLVGEWVIELV